MGILAQIGAIDPSAPPRQSGLKDWPNHEFRWEEEKLNRLPVTEWYNRYPIPYSELLEDGEEQFPYA